MRYLLCLNPPAHCPPPPPPPFFFRIDSQPPFPPLRNGPSSRTSSPLLFLFRRTRVGPPRLGLALATVGDLHLPCVPPYLTQVRPRHPALEQMV
ncbi:hypothetical protein G6O67_005918 [Ophiocordyceps sinensis]|uniref:Uncharacterized protein n=1 Tax=Ophiocordyceps sinensis TaxID=72228 RepID=A0A8H4LYG2_9HYPO|nr:hypothetical protein G6O67_005918 [Ophiocordyceps sinensis]